RDDVGQTLQELARFGVGLIDDRLRVLAEQTPDDGRVFRRAGAAGPRRVAFGFDDAEQVGAAFARQALHGVDDLELVALQDAVRLVDADVAEGRRRHALIRAANRVDRLDGAHLVVREADLTS